MTRFIDVELGLNDFDDFDDSGSEYLHWSWSDWHFFCRNFFIRPNFFLPQEIFFLLKKFVLFSNIYIKGTRRKFSFFVLIV